MAGMDLDNGDDPKDRNFVTALARGLEVLRCFQAHETELTNTDFSERTGLPKPTVSRLTHTLCRLDYLVADPRTGTYRLGPGVLQLGFGVLAGMEIRDRALDQMRRLCEGPNSYITAALGERHRLDVVYVAVLRSNEDVALTVPVGTRLPLFYSAIGRAMLAGMRADEQETVFGLLEQEQPDRMAECREVFDKACEEFARDGYCRGYGEWRPDVNGIAVPVPTLDGSRIFGLNAGGPSFHVKPKQLESHYAGLLSEIARVLGQRV